MSDPKFVVYGLRDPRNDTLRYVGKAINGLRARLRQHLSPNQLVSRSPRAFWIKELLALGKQPVAEVIEVYKDSASLAAGELRWIEFYVGMGVELLNVRDGGVAANLKRKAKRREPSAGEELHLGALPAKVEAALMRMVEKVLMGRLRESMKLGAAAGKTNYRLEAITEWLRTLEQRDPESYTLLVARGMGYSDRDAAAILRKRHGSAYGSEVTEAIVRHTLLDLWDHLRAIDTGLRGQAA